MKKNFITVIAIILIFSLTLYFIFYRNNQQHKPMKMVNKKNATQKVKVITVSESTLLQKLELIGNVEAYKISRLSTAAEGPITKLYVREGDEVKKGQLLIRIGRKKAVESKISSLKEEFSKEESNLKRVTALIKKDILPKENLSIAKVKLEKIRAELLKYQEILKDHRINAPWSGIISSVKVKEGQYVAPRVFLIEMYDPKSLVVSIDIPEKQAVLVKKNQKANISFDAYPQKQYSGTISRLYASLDPRMKTRKSEITLKDSIFMLPGMFARIILNLEEIKNIITIPIQAVQITTKGKTIVYKLKNGIAKKKYVKVGIEQNREIQILKGVEKGDTIIISGFKKLKDNAKVKIMQKKTKKEKE